MNRQWNAITRHDFKPIVVPAIEVIETVEDQGRLGGLERALHHIASEAERLAQSYADMGADHAGPLFNRVMGNQASDGAYFTRPPAASLCARLALDAVGDADWTDESVWRSSRILDPACGSGTLLAAALTDMERRARQAGADDSRIARLRKLAVEETVTGLDINPVSLQLAAAQLTTGNREIAYRRMGLHLMPHGPREDSQERVSIGTLELLGQKAVFPRSGELPFDDEAVGSENLALADVTPELEGAVRAVRDTRIAIMNPPFSNRMKMGEKFPDETKERMRKRMDAFLDKVIAWHPEMAAFINQNSIGPGFVALAEKCLDGGNGVLAMVNPTAALTGPSGIEERLFLAKAFHIDTVVSCHRRGDINFSQESSINESVIVARRHEGERPPTRFVALDRQPKDDGEAGELHGLLEGLRRGPIPDGWGEVSEWPAGRIEAGDWTAGAFRAPGLADGAFDLANHGALIPMEDQNMVPSAVLDGGAQMREFGQADADAPGGFPVLYSTSAEAQLTIRGVPDQHWAPKRAVPRHEWIEVRGADGPRHPDTARRIVDQMSHLMVTGGQDTGTGRLTAVAQETRCVGVGWLPVPGVSFEEAKAAAVFLNSTAGRLQLLRNAGRKLAFPKYRPAGLKTVRLPDLSDPAVTDGLARCWDDTAETRVPQYRDGECDVRRLWDETVCDTLGWDRDWMRELRHLLHREPHVRGMGYDEYADAAD